ncbi:DUF2490 domain-containing protein [Hymenobacter sp. ASUV-10]|uniref:DUF2490 domain-containing protein n=1 Tax=Hymenobacter aranciens TaxID=3063996 RepID=A0ABT9BIW8_9BACT|nr:DUF2490 domain-containing protein [Hymenobacter sp. ASUV-10]MDO7876581.1 DUF2490 domain-containing protein [Hymenobacter sp. ASUV-10]
MNKTILAGALLLALVGAAPSARAQAPLNPVQPWGSWVILTAQLPGSTEHRWGGYVEAQGRSNALARQFFYYELKGGVSFDIDPNFTFLVGGGRYSTSDYKDLDAGPLNTEKRLWEQLVLTQYSKRLKLEHRYRIEQRWFSFRDDSSSFRQRFRYRLNAFFPLNKKTITTGTLFLSAYDEIFLNPRGPVFERNRVYGGVGYQFTKHLIAQLGYVNQANYNYKTADGQFILQNTAAKNNLVLAVTYKFSHRAVPPGQERLPSQQD